MTAPRLTPLLAGLILPGCLAVQVRRERTALEDGLARVDALFAERARRERLEEARALLDLLSLDHDDPRLLARQARCDHALAYGFPEEAPGEIALYEAGRERAWRCLYEDPAFAGVLTSTGGRLGPAAVSRIGPERAECALWLVANWSRWLLAKDPAAHAIDLKPLSLLAERAAALTEGPLAGQAQGYVALVHTLPPRPFGPDLVAAEQTFERAILADPGNQSLRVDLAERVYRERDDDARFASTLERVIGTPPEADDPWALENARARARAQALLEDR